MSQSSRHHARKRAKDLSDEELKTEIARIAEQIPKLPTHEFDDKRHIHKKRTRQKVYREELEARSDRPTKLSPDTSTFEPEPMGTGYIAQVDAFIPKRFFHTKRRKAGAEVVSNKYKSEDRTAELTVRRERPREDFTESDAPAVEITVFFNDRKARFQRAPRPEKVADKLLAILGADS